MGAEQPATQPNTVIITAADLDSHGYYNITTLEAQGDIEIASNLGLVRFRGSVVAKGGIRISAGSSISAGGGISAGDGISAGSSISAGWGISCKTVLKVRLQVLAGASVRIMPTDQQQEIRCRRLEGGAIVALGRLIESNPA